MQSSIFTKSHEFNPTLSTITFQDVKRGSTGYGNVTYKYMINDLLIQTPKMTTPFGFSSGYPGGSGTDYNCQFNLDSNTTKKKAFRDSLEELEDIVLKYAYEKRIEWALFGNQTEAENATLDDVRDKMTKIVRPSKNPMYSPTFTAKFKKRKNKESDKWEIQTECTDEKNQAIEPSIDTIPPRSQCILIIRGKPIWISPEGKFGLTWQIERMKVYAPEKSNYDGGEASFSAGPKMPTGSCLLDDSDED